LADKVGGLDMIEFACEVITPGATIRTDGARMFSRLAERGYVHESTPGYAADDLDAVMPGPHLVSSLLKRWTAGTLHYRLSRQHLPYYPDEFTFRFNRRTSKARGMLFYRLLQQAVDTDPHPLKDLIGSGSRTLPAAAQVGAEACGGRAVDDVVVDGHREVQDVANGDLAIDDPGPSAQPAYDQRGRGRCGRRDREAPSAGEHADRGRLHGSGQLVSPHRAADHRVRAREEAGIPAGNRRQPPQRAPCGGRADVRLHPSDLSADVGDAANVGVPDDVHEAEWPLLGRYLNECLQVDARCT
jgi:hypothetical protein